MNMQGNLKVKSFFCRKSNAKLRANSIPRGARFAIRAPRKVSEGTLQKKQQEANEAMAERTRVEMEGEVCSRPKKILGVWPQKRSATATPKTPGLTHMRL